MERWATRAADAVIFEAPRIGEFLTQRIGVRKDRLSMIPNGVNLEVYHPAEAGWPGRAAIREELFKGEGLLIVGAVMSLLPKKNPFLLVDSAARVLKEIPRARFFIAGDGPLRSEVEERIREHGIGDKFRLLGIRRDIPELFRAIDMLALCSDREGCPNVVLEAMASGLPVVATYAGGTDQLVKDGENGRLVAIRDTDRFTEALTDLLDRPAAAALMGRKGLERVRENFSLQRMVDRTQELYEELLRHRSNGRSR
jgi:glycosyltransferase involved in cell wall biosynthesis